MINACSLTAYANTTPCNVWAWSHNPALPHPCSSALSALTRKKDDTPAAATANPTQTTESQPDSKDLITLYDAYGREVKITRNEWRDKIFLPNLQQKWNEASELYSLILSGLNDGFVVHLQPAAERLLEIDTNPERSHTILGIVLLKNGKLDTAEATLRAGMAKAGETGTLITNLAKVFFERGDQAQADETLWRAVQADPNQENGLMWWASIMRERSGEVGYLQALRTAAALPGSWRAQLWLARHHLEHEEVDKARALYTDVLANSLFDGSSLMMISGDLGNNGQITLILELIGPAYDEHKHDAMTGINLLRAYQELGKVDEGEALLTRMYALGIMPIKQYLDQFTQTFQEMRKQAAQGTPLDMESLKITTITLNQPIWHYGLRDADWLFSKKAEGALEIVFLRFQRSQTAPSVPNLNAKMIWGASVAPFRFTWQKPLTTGVITQPAAISRSWKAAAQSYQEARRTATHFSMLFRMG